MIIDPRPSFQKVWSNQKCWYLKNVQKDVECRRGVKGWLSGSVWVTAGHQSAPGGLEWLPSSSPRAVWHADPRPSFQMVWLNQKCWYLKNVQKDVECRRGVKGWLSGSVWVTAGHRSAPGVLEWLPSSSKSILTRIDLGKMIIDPPPSFQTVWLNQKCWYLKNVQKDVECRRGVKGWLTGSVWVTTGHQSAPGGLEWLPSSSPRAVWHADLRPSFQMVWLNQKC